MITEGSGLRESYVLKEWMNGAEVSIVLKECMNENLGGLKESYGTLVWGSGCTVDSGPKTSLYLYYTLCNIYLYAI